MRRKLRSSLSFLYPWLLLLPAACCLLILPFLPPLRHSIPSLPRFGKYKSTAAPHELSPPQADMSPAPAPAPSPSTAMASSSSQARSLRIGLEERRHPPERAASFHGKTAAPMAAEHRLMLRPKTQPELLSRAAAAAAKERRLPAKVLVNVTVQRSLGPVQVVACTDWTVRDLVAVAVRRYVEEGRRPPLPTTEPSAFALHYSQFSLESLASEEKLVGLGSRNFFLCRKPAPASSEGEIEADEASASPSSSTCAAGSCSKQAGKASKTGISWLSFMDCLL